jgi:hypothetical protein
MKTKPPFIAAWLLDRFGANPQHDAVAGDLLEQYRLGRSRFWYWREVITAIIVGTWAQFTEHPLMVLRAVAMGWLFAFLLSKTVWPYWTPLVVRYVIDAPQAWQPLLLELLIDGPGVVAVGWILARFGRQCRIAAIVAHVASMIAFTAVNIWRNPQIYDDWQWGTFFLLFPVMISLLLLGGGLLTGSPKRLTQMSQ